MSVVLVAIDCWYVQQHQLRANSLLTTRRWRNAEHSKRIQMEKLMYVTTSLGFEKFDFNREKVEIDAIGKQLECSGW